MPLREIIDWDVRNWSQCLPYWHEWIANACKVSSKVLVLGDRDGGLSLWFALLGFNVLCTDYHPTGRHVSELHERWGVKDRITYSTADAFRILHPDCSFDIIACKSVIGGLKLSYSDSTTRSLDNQRLATEEIRRALKPGGVFFGAENLTGTLAHMAIRNIRLKGRLGWRYLKISEIQFLFSGYSCCEQSTYGFLGTNWFKFEPLNAPFAVFDNVASRLLPPDWLYISFIRARK